MLLDEIIERLHILTSEGYFEIGFVSLSPFFLQRLTQFVQIDLFCLVEVIVLDVAQQLHSFFDILQVHELVLLKYLLYFWYFQDLLLERREFGFRSILL